MKFFKISNLPQKEILQGITLKSVHLQNLMVTFVTLAPGTVLPVHSHEHEQISVVISGMLRFFVEGEERIVGAGDVVCVPSHALHGAEVIEGPCIVYDSWSPVRKDYIV
ncbi:MAG: cupin domain-containing protein [Spirochaetes bacterium]|nr:cupin domain-containing protein [Spirochaetota bacterium]